MCTVAVIACADGLIMAGNRDELVTRSEAIAPARYKRDETTWLGPVDGKEGGTWTLVNEHRLALSLLNNYQAPQNTVRVDPISRGHVVRQLAGCESVSDVLATLRGGALPLTRVRPFVLVVVEVAARKVAEVSWDGVALTQQDRSLPALFVSNGKDVAEAQKTRSAAFARHLATWGEDGPTDAELVALFAGHEPEKGHFSLCMHFPPYASTRSLTWSRMREKHVIMRYIAGSPCTQTRVVVATLPWRPTQ